jgi:hypothetical protein
MTIGCNEEFENASDSIRINREFESNEIEESDPHQEKHFEPRVSTRAGIIIDWIEDRENASDPITFNCEFDSNEIEESDSHDEKHFEPRVSTLAGITIECREPKQLTSVIFARFKRKQFSTENVGITIDRNEVKEKTLDSIRFNYEFDSNEIEESDRHDEKHFEPRVSIRTGITIDCNGQSENVSDSIILNCEFDSNKIEESD